MRIIDPLHKIRALEIASQAHQPNAHLVIAEIMPKYSYAQGIADYNTYIRETLVPAYQAQGRKVTVVDQYVNFLTDTNDLTSIDQPLFSNGINHPDSDGYDKMAQTWFEGIEALTLGGEPGGPFITLGGSPTGDSVGEALSAGTRVGSFAVANTNTTFTYSWEATGTDNDSFNLTGGSSSNLVTAAAFDYETKTSYSIRMLATEAGPGSLLLTNTFTVAVTDEVESWGGVYALATVAPGATDVATLTSVTVQNTNVAYSVLAGFDATKFEITGAGADVLALTNASLAVLGSNYLVNVQAVGTPQNETNSVLIKVTVSNDAAPSGMVFTIR